MCLLRIQANVPTKITNIIPKKEVAKQETRSQFLHIKLGNLGIRDLILVNLYSLTKPALPDIYWPTHHVYIGKFFSEVSEQDEP